MKFSQIIKVSRNCIGLSSSLEFAPGSYNMFYRHVIILFKYAK